MANHIIKIKAYIRTIQALLVAVCLGCMTAPMMGQVNTIEGNVFLDHNGDGTSNAADYGHPAIRVKAVCDLDGDGTYSAGDQIAGVGFTDVNGDYTISLDHTPNTTVSYPVQFTTDDVEESNITGTVSRSEATLDPDARTVGIRFNHIEIPACATVTNAYIRFVSNTTDAGASLNIDIQNELDPKTYNIRIANDVTTRPYLGAPVGWNTGATTTGSVYNTPNLASLINPIINQAGWMPYNALAFQIDGTGAVGFASYDDFLLNGGSANDIPQLFIEYTLPVTDYVITLCTDDLDPTSTVTLDSDQVITAADISSGTNLTGIDYAFQGPPVFCYTIADNGNSDNPDELVVFNHITGTSRVVGSTGTFDIEAYSISPDGGTFFTVDGDQFGFLDPATGAFTAIGAPLGTVNGPNGVLTLGDIDGIAFDIDGTLWATERIAGGYDIMVQIDPATGAIVPGVFGGDDYVVLTDAGGTYPDDIDDIAIDPITGKLYGVANKSTGAGGSPIVNFDMLVCIDKATGELTDGCVVTLDGVDLNDIEGFTFSNSGMFIGTTGKDSKISTDQNQLSFVIDPATCEASDPVYVGAASDYETVDCLTGAPNEICGFVYIDENCDGSQDGIDASVEGVAINIYQDTDLSGTRTPTDPLIETILTDPNGYFTFQTAYNVDFPILVDVTGTDAAGLDPFLGTNELYVNFSDGFGGQKDSLLIPYCPPAKDLALEKGVSTPTASIGDTIQYTLTVFNEALLTTDNIEVTDVLPAGLTYVSHSPATENFVGNIWTIGTMTSADASTTLTINVVVNEAGDFKNSAEITGMDGYDSDSTPDNDDATEDDQDCACFSVPYIICDGESVDITAPDGHTQYEWYLDGVLISGATTQTITATAAGTYEYALDGNGLDTTGCCCPIYVEIENCCPPTICLPVTVTKN